MWHSMKSFNSMTPSLTIPAAISRMKPQAKVYARRRILSCVRGKGARGRFCGAHTRFSAVAVGGNGPDFVIGKATTNIARLHQQNGFWADPFGNLIIHSYRLGGGASIQRECDLRRPALYCEIFMATVERSSLLLRESFLNFHCSTWT